MKIVLQRSVKVSSVVALGRVALAEKRVAEHAVVTWASERLEAGRDAYCDQLCEGAEDGPLLGMSPIVGRRLGRACEQLGLLRLDRGRIVALTSEGRRVAASSEPRVFIPQLGVWVLFWTDDPLLLQPLLRIEPGREPSAHDERQLTNRPFGKLPEAVASLCDERGERPPLDLPAAKDSAPVRISSLESKVELGLSNDTLALELVFEPNAATSLRLSGKLGSSSIDRPLPAPRGHDHASVWRSLLRGVGAENAWSSSSQKLRMAFTGLPDEARRSFRQRMPFKAPAIEGLGRFDDAVVGDVPLEPASNADAQQWFEWLLIQHAQSTQWPDVLSANATKLRAHFRDFELRTPTQRELAQRARGKDRPRAAYWHLQAPLDLDGGIV